MKTLRNLGFLFVLGLFFAGCHSNDDEVGNWKKVESFGGTGRLGAVSFVLGERAYVGTGINEQSRELRDFYYCTANNDGDLTWYRDTATFPGPERLGAVAFSTGKVAYVGLGYSAGLHTGSTKTEEYFNDFYKYDGTTWKKVADFPGESRRYALGFYVPDPNNSGKGKAYVAYGQYNKGNEGSGPLKDWWEFDLETETWKEMTWTYGEKRAGACVAVIGSDAYIFTGQDGSSYPNDVIRFSPFKPESEQRVLLDPLKDMDGRSYDNDYGMIPRGYAVAFAVGQESDQSARIYLASGARGGLLSDCWEFNPYKGEKGRWDEVTSLPSFALRQAACAFVLNNIGYIAVGGATSVPGSSSLSVKQTSYLFEPGVDDDDQDDD